MRMRGSRRSPLPGGRYRNVPRRAPTEELVCPSAIPDEVSVIVQQPPSLTWIEDADLDGARTVPSAYHRQVSRRAPRKGFVDNYTIPSKVAVVVQRKHGLAGIVGSDFILRTCAVPVPDHRLVPGRAPSNQTIDHRPVPHAVAVHVKQPSRA